MKLSEMTDLDKRALATLVRVIVRVDGKLSPEEAAALERAAENLGADEFWQLLDESGHHDLTEDVIKAEARAVEGQEARQTIYGVLFGIATAGSIVVEEGWILDWLAETWGLETGVGPGEQAEAGPDSES